MNFLKILFINVVNISMIGCLTLDVSATLSTRIMCFFYVLLIGLLLNTLYSKWKTKNKLLSFGTIPLIYGLVGFFHEAGIMSFIESWQTPLIFLFLSVLISNVTIDVLEPSEKYIRVTSAE